MNNSRQQILYQRRHLVIITIMLVAILEVLDSTIVNVALPAMQASLGANVDEITWVLTSYIVASAIMIPLTGFLSDNFGQKNLLIVNISGFMVSSFLCGLTNSLDQMIILRICQGAFGAALIPLSQAILRESYPLDQQGKAMAIWGIGIMTAPVLGPTLGGYITEHASWRWIFYINAPLCIISLLLTFWVIPTTKRQLKKLDIYGLSTMIIGVGFLQLFLDQGNEKDWFSSNFIKLSFILSITGMVLFIIRSLTQKQPLVNLKLYRDRNFSISGLILLTFCACMFSLLVMQPIMLESLFHYPVIAAGWVMAPRGLASAIAMILASVLMKRINAKYLIAVGLLLCAYGSYLMSQYNLNVDMLGNIIPGLYQGLGMGLIMVPLTTYSLATIPASQITEGAGLYSYARMLGTSVGISVISTLVTRETQINYNQLSAHTSIFNTNLHQWFNHQSLTLHSPLGAQRLAEQIATQGRMIAFNDAYLAIAIGFVILIPLSLFLQRLDFTNTDMQGH